MERKLASIQLIKELEPIPDADFIEKATIMGWTCVVKKGNFQVGDKCIYVEIDSVLPDGPNWSEFMRPRGFRVKSARLRKQLSQGLALPLDVMLQHCEQMFHGCTVADVSDAYEVGTDVTRLLDITKHEPPVSGHEVAGSFPGEIPKTDEIRLQSCIDILDELRGRDFVVTVKLDGMSGTFLKRDGELIVCSRNWALKESDNAYWRVAKKYDLINKLPDGFCIQGEVCGPGIQKNRLQLKEYDLFVFNVFNVKQGRFLDYDEFVKFCFDIGLKTVPYDFEVTGDELKDFPFTLENFLELSNGKYEGTENRREGIVIRPLIESTAEALGGSRFSFKVINNEFLLKDED